jgi:hypothetical protein
MLIKNISTMKKLVFALLILLPCYTKAQSASYDPATGYEDHKLGRGLNHTDGTIGLGTYLSSNVAYIQTHSNHPLYFGNNSNATPKVVLATGGYLGVNLADGVMPAEKLEIRNGRISLTGWEDANKPTGIEFTNNAGSGSVAFLGMVDNVTLGFKSYTTNQNEIVFKTVSGQARLGVGNTNPNYTLDVNGTIRLNALAGTDRSLVKVKTDNTLSAFTTQPTISISPFEFTYSDQGMLNESNVGYVPGFASATWSSLGAYHFVEKTLQLPQGSILKNFTAYLLDNNPNGKMQACLSIMNSTTVATNTYCVLTNSDNPNAVALSLPSTIDDVVDNNQYIYIIKVESLNNGNFNGGWAADMGFGAIKISVGY